jgi:hypothetical protein
MRTSRQFRIDRALIRALANIGTYLLPEHALRDEIGLAIVPRPSSAEIDDAIRHADAEGRLIGVQADAGPKWKLSDIGRAWWAENQ